MIRALILLGLWAALPTPAQVGTAALYTDFRNEPAPGVLQALHQELDALMAPNGLHFVWKSLHENQFSASPELAVVTFSGRCDVLPPAPSPLPVTRLGWTHISDGIVLPFAEVDCNAILTYVSRDLWAKPAPSRESILGRAIARVTAHELLHILAGTAAHGDHGVDHPTLSVSQLLADDMRFDELEPAFHILRPAALPAVRNNDSPLAGRATYARGGCVSCHGSHAEGTRRGPRLHVIGHALNPIVLAAKLAKNQNTMVQRARQMKLAPPSLDENDISDLVHFLNVGPQ